MLKQYFKQALQLLRESPLISTISIAGTALSIAAIMLVVLMYQIQLTGFSPESNRDRMMHAYATEARAKDNSNRNRGTMSAEIVRECFYALETPEAVTATFSDGRPVSLPAKRLYKEYMLMSTDHHFWKVFDFKFTDGKPFTEADFQSGIRNIVINETLARDLFGKTDVVGETIILDFMDYTVCGVVKDVSAAASNAYAQMWRPYTTDETLLNLRRDGGVSGYFRAIILAKSSSDFDAIESELERRRTQYNESNATHTVDFIGGILRQTDIAMGSNGFTMINTTEFIKDTGGLLLFLLLVPALNLTGVTQSSIQRRREEIGLRKSFGATKGILVQQILFENFVTTFIGGILGVILSFILFPLFKSFLLTDNPALNTEMMLQPLTLIIALLFMFLLNLASAGVPAIRYSRQPIVDALKNEE